MGAVHKDGGVLLLADLPAQLQFCRASIPYKAKIPAYQQDIPFFQPPERFVRKPCRITVQITCYINQSSIPPGEL